MCLRTDLRVLRGALLDFNIGDGNTGPSKICGFLRILTQRVAGGSESQGYGCRDGSVSKVRAEQV